MSSSHKTGTVQLLCLARVVRDVARVALSTHVGTCCCPCCCLRQRPSPAPAARSIPCCRPGARLTPPLLEWHGMGTSYLLLNGACSPVSLCVCICSLSRPQLPPPPPPQTGNATSADVAAAVAAADPQPGNPALLMSVLPLNQECFGRPDGGSGAPFRCPRPDVSTGLQANWQVVLASALSVLAGQLPRVPPGCQAALK